MVVLYLCVYVFVSCCASGKIRQYKPCIVVVVISLVVEKVVGKVIQGCGLLLFVIASGLISYLFSVIKEKRSNLLQLMQKIASEDLAITNYAYAVAVSFLRKLVSNKFKKSSVYMKFSGLVSLP